MGKSCRYNFIKSDQFVGNLLIEDRGMFAAVSSNINTDTLDTTDLSNWVNSANSDNKECSANCNLLLTMKDLLPNLIRTNYETLI